MKTINDSLVAKRQTSLEDGAVWRVVSSFPTNARGKKEVFSREDIDKRDEISNNREAALYASCDRRHGERRVRLLSG